MSCLIGYQQRGVTESLSLEIFFRAVLKAAQVDDELQTGNPMEALFDGSLGRSKKRLIAVCLLRLLDIDHNLLTDREFRVKVFRLFDEAFSDDIYKYLHIDKKHQTYEKASKISGLVSEVERQLDDAISSFGNLQLLGNFREEFMRCLNNNLSRAILFPFLPRNLLGTRMAEIFKKVEEYLSEKDAKALWGSYTRAKEVLQVYHSEADDYGTKYSSKYLGGVAKKLMELLDAHFKATPLSSPAELSVGKLEKKYPFYAAGTDIHLDFVVKNDGPGYAFDVEIEAEATISSHKSRQYLGQIEPRSSVEVRLPYKVEKPGRSASAVVKVSWINFDGTPRDVESTFELKSQRSDIDWQKLSKEQPYTLEPATTDDEFVGRREILVRLESLVTSRSGVGSAFVYGQKRVGKTSIVKVCLLYTSPSPRD